MGKCLTSMNCNENENTKFFETTIIEVNDVNKRKIINEQEEVNISEGNVLLKKVKYSQIVLSIGNMLISSSTYSYMLKSNSNLEDFISNKMKGISLTNQIHISKFMFENIRIKQHLPITIIGHDVILNTIQSLIPTVNDILGIKSHDGIKNGLNKMMINIVVHLTEIHHFVNYQLILMNQKRDDYYNRNYWVNIEDISDYFNIKIAECAQNLQNIKLYLTK